MSAQLPQGVTVTYVNVRTFDHRPDTYLQRARAGEHVVIYHGRTGEIVSTLCPGLADVLESVRQEVKTEIAAHVHEWEQRRTSAAHQSRRERKRMEAAASAS